MQIHGSIVPEAAAGAATLDGFLFEPFNVPVHAPAPVSQRLARDLAVAVDAPVGVAGLMPLPHAFRITHLQRRNRPNFTMQTIGGPGRYRPTAWLALYAPKSDPRRFTLALPLGGKNALPIVLRALPSAPVLETETATSSAMPANGNQRALLEAARRWTSTRDWRQDGQPLTTAVPACA